MNTVGLDPGKTGAIVLLSQKGEIILKSVLPLDGAGDLNKVEFIDLLSEFNLMGPFHVYLERIIPFALNAKGALAFGRQLGMIEQILWERKYPVTFVEPSRWTKLMHQGINSNIKAKAKSAIAVERLFPSADLRATERSKKPHDGLIDALLLAEYGRRMMGGIA